MTSSLTTAYGRINALLDAGSFVEIGAHVAARYSAAGEVNGDGVATGYGTIDGALVYVYAQDPSYLGGSIGEMHARKISKLYDLAMSMKAPVIAIVDCAGVRLNEGNDSLYSFGRMFAHQAKASGIVPQITAVFGTCGGGMAVAAAMSDFVFMENDGKLFLNSPNAVKGNYEGKCDTAAASFQAEKTGLADFVGTADEVYAGIRELVSMIPHSNTDDFSFNECSDDLNRAVAGIDALKCKCEMIQQIADDGKYVEVKAANAPCISTGFIKLNGSTVGVVANNSSEKAICFGGCKKAIHFINFCDAFNVPLLTLVDVDGFKRDELNDKLLARGLGKLAYTFANATVPKVTLVVGDAYGTAGVVMNSKALGADLVYAWTGAKMGLMDQSILEGLTEAVDKDINAAEYNARRGYVDDIIVPAETRQRLVAAFEMLYSKEEDLLPKKHGTV
ncbi:MAG: carboxyl transferase domain-containing protein [Lachnospiraceae bacterium]|nr:carboxyl transferase domain-containing protein [Lachnospiraceae bacterium]